MMAVMKKTPQQVLFSTLFFTFLVCVLFSQGVSAVCKGLIAETCDPCFPVRIVVLCGLFVVYRN